MINVKRLTHTNLPLILTIKDTSLSKTLSFNSSKEIIDLPLNKTKAENYWKCPYCGETLLGTTPVKICPNCYNLLSDYKINLS